MAFGSIVGFVQGNLAIKRFGTGTRGVRTWIMASVLAWAIAFPGGQQFLRRLFWMPPDAPVATWIVIGTVWGIIAMITEAALFWLGKTRQ